jgi:hypothetical protein
MTHGNRVTRNEETSRFGVAVTSGLQDTRLCIAGNVFERAAVLHVRHTAFDVGYHRQILHVTTTSLQDSPHSRSSYNCIWDGS